MDGDPKTSFALTLFLISAGAPILLMSLGAIGLVVYDILRMIGAI